MIRHFILGLAGFVFYACATDTSSNQEIVAEETSLLEDNTTGNSDNSRKLALPADTLLGILPAEISGYRKIGEHNTNVDNIGASQFTSAHQKYRNNAGSTIDISLTDYNAAPALFEGALSFYFSGMKLEEKGRRMESFDRGEDLIGWTAIDTEQQEFAIFAGYKNRYYLALKAENIVDINELHKVLENFPFDDLP